MNHNKIDSGGMATKIHDFNVFTNEQSLGFEYIDPVKVIDSNWVTTSWLTDTDKLDPSYARGRFYSFGDTLTGNTRLGLSRSLNPLPGIGLYIDKPTMNRLKMKKYTDDNGNIKYSYHETPVTTSMDSLGELGSGTYHSDVYQKYEQILYLEFGVPKFSSMYDVLSSLVDREELIAATRGGSADAYKIGKGIVEGVLFFYRAIPFLAGTALKFLVSSVFDRGRIDYYTLKPTMHNYLITVSKIWQQFGVELGAIIPVSDATAGSEDTVGIPMKLTADSFMEVAEYYPQVLSNVPGTDVYYLDIFKVVSSSFRDARYQKDMIAEVQKAVDNGDGDKVLESFVYRGIIEGEDNIKNPRTMLTFYESIVGGMSSYSNQGDIDKKKTKEEIDEEKSTYLADMGNYALQALGNGSKYIPLTVNYIGETTYTWGNSVGEIELEGMLNSGSKFVEDKRFSTFGGNIFGDIATDILNAGKDALLGGLDGATFGLSNIINGLMHGGRMTLPKKYMNSTVNMPKHTFELPVTATSGDPLVQLMTTYLHISLLLGATLPRSIGDTTYVSPYLCSGFLRGIMNSKLCMIDDLKISFGVGNMGRDDLNRPVVSTITFSLVDMSEMMSVRTPTPTKILSIMHDDNEPLSLFIRNAVGASLVRESSTQSIFGGPTVLSRVSRALFETAGITSEARLGHKLEEFIPWWRNNAYERNLENIATGNSF